jgi:protein phosphatase
MRAVPDITEASLAAGGPDADNCTVVAMSWAGAESIEMVPPTEAPVSTLVIPEGAVASTVQIPRVGEEAPADFTEDKIDEAVAEIQRAIQRSSRLIGRQG